MENKKRLSELNLAELDWLVKYFHDKARHELATNGKGNGETEQENIYANKRDKAREELLSRIDNIDFNS